MKDEKIFLACFDNETNGGAKVVKIEKNIILGYISNFGYAVFEPYQSNIAGKVHRFFKEVTPFGKLEEAELIFEQRKDGTGYLTLDKKIKMIKDVELKTFVTSKVSAMKNRICFDRCESINVNNQLRHLDNFSLIQLIDYAKHSFQSTKANDVFWAKFLIKN